MTVIIAIYSVLFRPLNPKRPALVQTLIRPWKSAAVKKILRRKNETVIKYGDLEYVRGRVIQRL